MHVCHAAVPVEGGEAAQRLRLGERHRLDFDHVLQLGRVECARLGLPTRWLNLE